MSIWQRDSASTVDPPTISRPSALPWPPITPERPTSPPPKSQLPQPLLLPLPSPAQEKSSPSTACWLCWWTCPYLFFYIISGNSLYISASSLSNKQENEMDRNHLVIPCTLTDCDIKIDTHALVDCGYTGLSFMNKALACQHNFRHYQLKTPKTVEVIDDHPISLGDIMEYVEV
jgi:hypothetical protein